MKAFHLFTRVLDKEKVTWEALQKHARYFESEEQVLIRSQYEKYYVRHSYQDTCR